MGLLESIITSESELHEREYFYGSQTILQLCYSTYIQFMKYLPMGLKQQDEDCKYTESP